MSEFDPQEGEVKELTIRAKKTVDSLLAKMSSSVIGMDHLKRRLIQALIADGHVLIEGVPGLAKTLSIKTLANCLAAKFARIQFTPDLLPSDIVGTEVFISSTSSFEVRLGPVFANFVLADEINRAPAKVQSALLEVMQEKQITLSNQTYKVPDPFLVLATQNPIEQEGTYSLPEAQVDRFMMKVKVDYPEPQEEKMILDLHDRKNREEGLETNNSETATSINSLRDMRRLRSKIYVDDRIKSYIVNLVACTRDCSKFGLDSMKPMIDCGASPRASLSLFYMAQAEALLQGERFVVPQNVKDCAMDALRHRIITSYYASAQGVVVEDLINSILNAVPVP